MGKNLIRTTNFFMDLFVKQKVPDIYAKIQFWNNECTLYEQRRADRSVAPHLVHSIALIPDYFHLTVKDPNSITVKTFDQTNHGYAIMIESGFNIETYLKEQFGSNHRNIKKRHSRLETCFNINYKIFYGELNEAEYHSLMKSLHTMLTRRFKQRGEINEKLLDWDELLDNTYAQIREKKASLFVIYDHTEPIDISINYHFEKIMFGAVSSYDIDYAKFGLGSIEKIKLLEWCLSHDYKIMDFGYGDLEYKRLWSNYSYHFKYQVLYDPHSFYSKTIAKFELLKLSLKEYLKSKKIDVYYNRVKAMGRSARNKPNSKVPNHEYERARVLNLHGFDALKDVGVEQTGPFPIKSVLNDFLYTTMEHKNDVVILAVEAEPGTFFLSGKKNIQKITFDKTFST